jgi:hypothetical protein
MKAGTCPKCGSNEVLSNLRVHSGGQYPPYVDIVETDLPSRPFIWSPKTNGVNSPPIYAARVGTPNFMQTIMWH